MFQRPRVSGQHSTAPRLSTHWTNVGAKMRTAPRVQGDKGDPEFEFPRRLIGWRRSRDPRSAALIGRAAGGRVAMFKATGAGTRARRPGTRNVFIKVSTYFTRVREQGALKRNGIAKYLRQQHILAPSAGLEPRKIPPRPSKRPPKTLPRFPASGRAAAPRWRRQFCVMSSVSAAVPRH